MPDFLFAFGVTLQKNELYRKMDNAEKICYCALNRIFGFSPTIGSAIIDTLGSASKVFTLTENEKNELFGPYSKFRCHINDIALKEAEKELQKASDIGASFIYKGQNCYPTLLNECDDSPLGIYIKSKTPPSKLFNNTISIVGTRDISPYGKEWCERLVKCISNAQNPPTIVSGLALGTDIIAHNAALTYGLGTIAVMATGIDSIYPARHTNIALKIANTDNCALITDYPIGTSPKQINFIRRNRIIAGLSNSTILIESKLKGGGMITARQAFSYSRNVYTIPGRIDDIRSQGCNELIRTNMAEAITSEDSLAQALGISMQEKKKISIEQIIDNHSKTWNLNQNETDEMAKILLTIKKNRGITLSEISTTCYLNYQKVAELAGILENDGLITKDLLQRCVINSKY